MFNFVVNVVVISVGGQVNEYSIPQIPIIPIGKSIP